MNSVDDAPDPDPGASDSRDEREESDGREDLDLASDRLRRRVLWSMPSGLYLIGSSAEIDGQRRSNLMTANLVMQVCVEPKLIAASIDVASLTYELICSGGSFSVSLLRREDRPIVRKFVKPVTDFSVDDQRRVSEMAREPVFELQDGLPVLTRSLAWLACTVKHRIELGTHALFIGELTGVGGDPVEDRRIEVLRMEDTRMNYGG
ncbi:MAG: flavin reductase family protein [Acidimicrobiales bacterium]